MQADPSGQIERWNLQKKQDLTLSSPSGHDLHFIIDMINKIYMIFFIYFFILVNLVNPVNPVVFFC